MYYQWHLASSGDIKVSGCLELLNQLNAQVKTNYTNGQNMLFDLPKWLNLLMIIILWLHAGSSARFGFYYPSRIIECFITSRVAVLLNNTILPPHYTVKLEPIVRGTLTVIGQKGSLHLPPVTTSALRRPRTFSGLEIKDQTFGVD